MGHPQSFLNVNNTHADLFYLILALKSMFVGYGTKKVPKYLTVTLIMMNMLSVYLHRAKLMVVTLFYNAAAAVLIYLLQDALPTSKYVLVWFFMCFDPNSQFLLDIFTITSLLILSCKMFPGDYGKLWAWICFNVFVEWYFDNYPIDMYSNILVNLHVGIAIMGSLPMLMWQSTRLYTFSCLFLAAWHMYVSHKIDIKTGLSTGHPTLTYFFNLIHSYISGLPRHFGLTQFLARTNYSLIGIHMEHNISTLIG